MTVRSIGGTKMLLLCECNEVPQAPAKKAAWSALLEVYLCAHFFRCDGSESLGAPSTGHRHPLLSDEIESVFCEHMGIRIALKVSKVFGDREWLVIPRFGSSRTEQRSYPKGA